jgi:hypothetical protein
MMDQSNTFIDKLHHAQPMASTKYREMDEDELPNESDDIHAVNVQDIYR